MSPRTGRPTEEPKNHRKGFRLSDEDIKKLKFCVEHTDMSEADVVRKGIDLVYSEVKKK